MNVSHVLTTVALLLTAAPAGAQSQPAASPWQDPSPTQVDKPWPGQAPQQQPANSPWNQPQQQPANSPWNQPAAPADPAWNQQAAPQQPSAAEEACMREFGKLRDDAQKRAGLIQKASARKPTAKEACGLFNSFSSAEEKMIKYAIDNRARCGIPPQVADTLKQQHVKTGEIRTRVCQAAAAPPRQAGPTLSDALGGAVPDSNNIKTGRGTYDTLTGTPLGTR